MASTLRAIEATVQPRFISVDGAAARTSLSRATIERWLAQNLLRGYRPNGSRRVLIDVEELDRVVTGG